MSGNAPRLGVTPYMLRALRLYIIDHHDMYEAIKRLWNLGFRGSDLDLGNRK